MDASAPETPKTRPDEMTAAPVVATGSPIDAKRMQEGAKVDHMELAFPETGAASTVITTHFNARSLFLGSFFFWLFVSAGRFILFPFFGITPLMYFSIVDTAIVTLHVLVLFYMNERYHFRPHYLYAHQKAVAQNKFLPYERPAAPALTPSAPTPRLTVRATELVVDEHALAVISDQKHHPQVHKQVKNYMRASMRRDSTRSLLGGPSPHGSPRSDVGANKAEDAARNASPRSDVVAAAAQQQAGEQAGAAPLANVDVERPAPAQGQQLLAPVSPEHVDFADATSNVGADQQGVVPYVPAAWGSTGDNEIIHCFAVLHYKEPEEQLYTLCENLADQKARGRKVLLIGMEKGTPDKEKKMEKIAEIANTHPIRGGPGEQDRPAFEAVLYTVHTLRPGEIPGTGSNHFQCQVVAELFFGQAGEHMLDKVIFSKFDCNMRLSGPLVEEMEAAWELTHEDERVGLSFMPNVCWAADVHDEKRSACEIAASCAMCCGMNIAPFSIAFVSGSLASAIKAGYTSPTLLPEDEMLFTKRAVMVPHSRTVRLYSRVMKTFYPAECSSYTFVFGVFWPKYKRWFAGWLELHAYMFCWLVLGPRLASMHDEHPRRRSVYWPRAWFIFLMSVLRKYMCMVAAVGAIPMTFVHISAWNDSDHYLDYGRGNYHMEVEDWLYEIFATNPSHAYMTEAYGYPLSDEYMRSLQNYRRAQFQTMLVAVGTFFAVITAFRSLRKFYLAFPGVMKFNAWAFFKGFLVTGPMSLLMTFALLYTYLKHGLLNEPMLHSAQGDTVAAMQKGGAPSSASPSGDKPSQEGTRTSAQNVAQPAQELQSEQVQPEQTTPPADVLPRESQQSQQSSKPAEPQHLAVPMPQVQVDAEKLDAEIRTSYM